MACMQYVIFMLNDEYYGIDIQKVREIGPYVKSTQIPDTPEFIEGIINFRGDIIPVINLRKLFMMESVEKSKGTRIIIVNEGDNQLGIIVDEASEVLYINGEDIGSPSDISTGKNRRLINAIGKVEDRIIMLIDLFELVSGNFNILEAL